MSLPFGRQREREIFLIAKTQESCCGGEEGQKKRGKNSSCVI